MLVPSTGRAQLPEFEHSNMLSSDQSAHQVLLGSHHDSGSLQRVFLRAAAHMPDRRRI